jgi:hypothetical protein
VISHGKTVVSGSGRHQFGRQALPLLPVSAPPRPAAGPPGRERATQRATNRTGSTAGSGSDGAREVRANDSARGAGAGAVGGDPDAAPAGRQLVTGDCAARRCYGRGWACQSPTAVYPSRPGTPPGRGSVGRACACGAWRLPEAGRPAGAGPEEQADAGAPCSGAPLEQSDASALHVLDGARQIG